MSDNVPKPKFWLEDPTVLVKSFSIFPDEKMTRNEKLNALTRLAVLISAGLYWAEYQYWSTFLLVAILGIIAMKYACPPAEKSEGFSIPPTYNGVNYQETVLAPTFAEEWQIPPIEYDLVDEVYDEDDVEGTYGPMMTYPRSSQTRGQNNGYKEDDGDRYVKLGDLGRYKDPLELDPYGQYLTRTNQLPADENWERSRGTLSTARAFANSAFQRHRDAFQEDMTRIHKKKMARRYAQNLYTVSSAYTSRN